MVLFVSWKLLNVRLTRLIMNCFVRLVKVDGIPIRFLRNVWLTFLIVIHIMMTYAKIVRQTTDRQLIESNATPQLIIASHTQLIIVQVVRMVIIDQPRIKFVCQTPLNTVQPTLTQFVMIVQQLSTFLQSKISAILTLTIVQPMSRTIAVNAILVSTSHLTPRPVTLMFNTANNMLMTFAKLVTLVTTEEATISRSVIQTFFTVRLTLTTCVLNVTQDIIEPVATRSVLLTLLTVWTTKPKTLTFVRTVRQDSILQLIRKSVILTFSTVRFTKMTVVKLVLIFTILQTTLRLVFLMMKMLLLKTVLLRKCWVSVKTVRLDSICRMIILNVLPTFCIVLFIMIVSVRLARLDGMLLLIHCLVSLTFNTVLTTWISHVTNANQVITKLLISNSALPTRSQSPTVFYNRAINVWPVTQLQQSDQATTNCATLKSNTVQPKPTTFAPYATQIITKATITTNVTLQSNSVKLTTTQNVKLVTLCIMYQTMDWFVIQMLIIVRITVMICVICVKRVIICRRIRWRAMMIL